MITFVFAGEVNQGIAIEKFTNRKQNEILFKTDLKFSIIGLKNLKKTVLNYIV